MKTTHLLATAALAGLAAGSSAIAAKTVAHPGTPVASTTAEHSCGGANGCPAKATPTPKPKK